MNPSRSCNRTEASLGNVTPPIAEWNPVSALTASVRDLWGNPNPFAAKGFPAEHPILLTLLWIVAIVAVFGPLGVRRYRAMSR